MTGEFTRSLQFGNGIEDKYKEGLLCLTGFISNTNMAENVLFLVGFPEGYLIED